MTPGQIALRALILGFILTLAVITGFAYTTLLERKVLARLQARVGPNRTGYIPLPRRGGGKERRLLSGFMQPAADAVKLFFKEDPTPAKVDRPVYNLAPMMALIPAIPSVDAFAAPTDPVTVSAPPAVGQPFVPER